MINHRISARKFLRHVARVGYGRGGVFPPDIDFFFVIKIGAISSILNKFTVIMYFYFRYKHTVCMFI